MDSNPRVTGSRRAPRGAPPGDSVAQLPTVARCYRPAQQLLEHMRWARQAQLTDPEGALGTLSRFSDPNELD